MFFAKAPKARIVAFTLVELLVVVAILALLLAILLPSLGAARAQSRAATCGTNLRELGIATHVYADENRDALIALLETRTGYVHWIQLLEPYIKTPAICRCRDDQSTNWAKDPFHDTQGLRTTSFVLNHEISPDLGIYKRGQVQHPARTVFFAEFKDDQVGDHFHPESWALFLETPEDELALERHRGQANYWFIDGHTVRLPFARTWDSNAGVDAYDPHL